MNIISLVPVHPCREVIIHAAMERGVAPLWADNAAHFSFLLGLNKASFGIIASGHRMVPEAVTVRNIRNAGNGNPLYVMLLGRDSDHSSIATALNVGADQAEVWPIDPRVLSAQIGAIIGRDRGDPTEIISFGGVEFNTSTGDVVGPRGRVHMTRVEGTILAALATYPNRLLSKQFIYRAIYHNDGGPDPKIIDIFIHKIRKKLSAICALEHIETVWGVGFRFDADGFPVKTTDMRVAPHRREAAE